jgi:signal transduction histidine kinase
LTAASRDVEAAAAVGHDDTQDLDALRQEFEELRASRMRVVLAADADRRRLERELHDGVQQRLVALAVELQLLEASLDSDPEKAREHLQELARDVDLALAEAARLAERISPSIWAPGDLAPALRGAAAGFGTPVRVHVETPVGCPPEVFATVHECFLEVLAQAGAEELEVTVRDDVERLSFEIVAVQTRRPELVLDRIRDRVEALGGDLTIETQPVAGLLVTGSLPLSLSAR